MHARRRAMRKGMSLSQATIDPYQRMDGAFTAPSMKGQDGIVYL